MGPARDALSGLWRWRKGEHGLLSLGGRYAGHASVAFTLTRYVKALAGTETDDAARMEAFLTPT